MKFIVWMVLKSTRVISTLLNQQDLKKEEAFFKNSQILLTFLNHLKFK